MAGGLARPVGASGLMKFVVISAGRSGSSLLASTIDQHPDLRCADEILHTSPEVRARHYRRVLDDGQFLRSSDADAARKWLDGFYERAGTGLSGVGFKHVYEVIDMLGHWSLFEGMPDLRIIHLVRNPLMSHISFQEARAGNPWHERTGSGGGRVRALADAVRSPRRKMAGRVFLYPAEVVLWTNAISRWRERVRGMGVPTMEVSYGELNSSFQAAADRVFGFLDVSSHVVAPAFRKTGRPDVRQRVANWDEFVALLPGPYRWLLDDLI